MIVFVHVERTAGSSIHAWFSPYNNPVLEGRYFVVSNFDQRQMAAAKNCPAPSYLGGHFSISDLSKVGIEDQQIAVLFASTRDPVERAVSLYMLMRRSPDWLPLLAPHVEDRDFGYFYDFCLDHRYYFPNDQCRRIGGAASFVETRRVIRNRYTFVGASDRIDLIGDALSRLLVDKLPGFKPTDVWLNAAPRQLDDCTISPALRMKIEENNSEDILLHKFIIDEGGIVFGRS